MKIILISTSFQRIKRYIFGLRDTTQFYTLPAPNGSKLIFIRRQ